MLRRSVRNLVLSLLAGVLSPASAGNIAIIIDDIGYSQYYGNAAVSLHPNITLSILPEAPFATQLAETAIKRGNEVMLHLPMQANSIASAHEHGELSLDMSEQQFKRQVRQYLSQFPLIAGVNNHMGSLLTRHPGHMGWLMEVLTEYPELFFVDSRTHHKTVAAKIASEYFIQNASRDVFLDSDPADADSIRRQFQRLLEKADQTGFALAIGHPRPETIRALKRYIPQLEAKGHTLIPVNQYIQLKGNIPCPECSSPLLKVVKNLKQ